MFFEIWMDLRPQCPDEYMPKRAGRSNLLPVFYAAILLDHRYHGLGMDTEEVRKGTEYINQCDASLAPEVSKYLAKFFLY